MADEHASSPLVVIGASAGGIEALSTLLAALPPSFPAPIVIAQHLDPTRASHLAEFLARHSPLPLHTVETREPLAPGVVYVVPSNRDVVINDHEVGLRAGAAGLARPSVDVLLSSAANHYGERLIAVILSGTGSDGAAGARVVKRAGGTVIIQDPKTAAYPGMPLSLAPNTVDVVAPLTRIAQVLASLVTGGSVPTRADDKKAVNEFLDEVRERQGIDFRGYKTPIILRRLERRIVATDSGSLDSYICYVRTHPEEYQHLANTFLIKVTEFFRDGELFVYLRDRVVPDLISSARKHGNALRIWSAGCATGEEAYSLAILICEILKDEVERFNVRIFATDADVNAIAFARRGIYPANALTGLSNDLIQRYFTETEGSFQVQKRVRALTIFGLHDLGARAPFPHMDMVMCRNVLIYFTRDLQQRTLHMFAYSLRDGGYLVLGKAESIAELTDLFAPDHPQIKVFCRHGDQTLMPLARYTRLAPAPHAKPATHGPSTDQGRAAHETQLIQSRNENLLLRLPVGIVVVDRRYDIHTINNAARRFLSIYGPAIGEDLIHASQGLPHSELRSAVDAAFREGHIASVDAFAIAEVATGETCYLDIRCYPHADEGDRKSAELVLVVIQDVTNLASTRRQVEEQLRAASDTLRQVQTSTQEESARRQQVIDRLVESNRQLTAANRELADLNEMLHSANEELSVNTEEAQATTEEVETLNEEMQATNEELETLNEELQATIEELNTTNDDLAARSAELQHLANTAEAERGRLAAILANIREAVLVVNHQGEIVLTNAAYEQMFGGAGARIVPRDEAGHPLPAEAAPQRRAARGESFSIEFTTSAPDGAQRVFECSGGSITDFEGAPQGGVVVIRDITERGVRRLQE